MNVSESVAAAVAAKFAIGKRVAAILGDAALVGAEWLPREHVLALTSIERVVPVDSSFKCEIDDASSDTEFLLYVTVSSKKLKIQFELKHGKPTAEFIDELFRAIEIAEKFPEARQFTWLHKYTGSKKSNVSSTEMGSPDIVVSRQQIARGITPSAVRDSMIKYQMKMKEYDYTYTQSFKIFVGTWNINGQPPTASLKTWLTVDSSPPDIYAVGFQELDLSKEALLFDFTIRENEWLDAVNAGLDTRTKYHKVELVRLVGMMLIIYAQRQHMEHIKNVAYDTVGTGIMGKMGNKGGVSIRFELHNTSFCFVNSHLAAHVEEYDRRNQDYHDICNRTHFSRIYPNKTIKDHNQIFWLGDLNYRITNMNHVTVKELLLKNNIEAVLGADQLRIQCEASNVLNGFTEGAITFQPTYKYDPGTDNWDSSEKVRAPAWCDRIFWKGEDIKQLSYQSHPQLNISDHKPVSALFISQVKVIDLKKYRKVHEDVIKKLDKLENEFLPHVTVEPTEIIFDNVKYLEPQAQEVCIANTGQVPVQFEFIKKLEESTYCKDWLNIEPYTKCLNPGEKCDVRLEVFIYKKSAFKFNSGEDKLYDILVLHLDGGKDIFITVNGTYKKSCFGTSIETLIHLKAPVREVHYKRLIESEVPNQQNPYLIPKEVYFLVNHIYVNGLNEPNLFKLPGRHCELLGVRDWLDSGSLDELPGSIHSVTEALMMLLESTSEPIIPYNHHYACLNASSNYLLCKQIIAQLPAPKKAVYLYLCSFLQEVLNHSGENGTDSKTLASLFGALFLRDPPQHKSKPLYDRKKAMFVHHFLVNNQTHMVFGD
ncbi:type II inositol 1,4,5-trisphosphate 5-phosphatase-like [Arctopsyche grandis]|uniref:type II inositol 1,4,5-trisphosphate 5-phosphatase-like n=1 Tax=Arctopsyche grandis TaxID=121162 RepID=UPI00406DA3F0